MSLVDVFLLCLLGAFAAYWWHAQGCKHRALQVAKQHCHKMQVQLLDDSVVLRRLSWERDQRGHVSFCRHYQFEFSSTYDDRYKGQLVLQGKQLKSIELGIYRI